MEHAKTAIILGAGASYCYQNSIPTQANIIGKLYMGIGTSSGIGAPNFLGTYGLKHSYELGVFLREILGIPENNANDKLDFWTEIQKRQLNLEKIYMIIENSKRFDILEDFKSIIRTNIIEPAGDRQEPQVCKNHRIIAENMDPGDYIIDFNWDSLMADALLFYSPLWFPRTGFGVDSVLPIMNNKIKQTNDPSLVDLFHIHGSVVLFEEVTQSKQKKHLFLGGRTYNSFTAYSMLSGIQFPDNRCKQTQSKSKYKITESDIRKIELGWIFIDGQWFSPLFTPPSKYKAEYATEYSKTMKRQIHSRLPFTKQIVIAGYSFPENDIDYLDNFFPKQIIDPDTYLIIVNMENEDPKFRERVNKVFPNLTRIDYTKKDFNSFCNFMKNEKT